MTAEVLQLLTEGVDPHKIELPEQLPEDPRLSMVRQLLGELYRQQYDPDPEPLPVWMAEWLTCGLFGWLEGESWEKGLGLQNSKGQDLAKSFWVRARDRHLAEMLMQLTSKNTGIPESQWVDLLIRSLELFEQGRYPVWKNAGGPPPEASPLQVSTYKALHAAERCGGWPRDKQRMLERLKDGALCLVADL